ncbi:porin [Parabacteroides sp. AM08-6]|uniref:porin n=1 Tax=Parabacteroides sp. AM08-6 TaxID=2292053 RepID=UPI000F0068C6|nr:porin [Parabacteroides sp. AM08-6]RHJ85367.1 hypothetical protein DW103_03970 [Parabacteroides sp. AM08-6]
MKTWLKSAVLLLGMGMVSAHSQAQKVVVEDNEPNSVMFVSIDKAGDEVIRIMNETQSPRFHEPKAPRFLLTDRKGQFALGIGGYVKTTAEYDFNGISDNVDFYPALIPRGGLVKNQFQLDATTSTIFLKLVGHTKLLGDFVVYTAGNFRGGSGKTFELRNAYASFLGFTIGYDYGSFMDLGNVPATIDFAGPNGLSIYHATQIRYERTLAQGFKAGIGVEMPVVDGLTNNNLSISTQRMPNFPAYLQYSWNKNSHVRVAGIVRSMTYEDLVANKAESEVGWGVLASATFHVGSCLQLYGQGVYGRGIAQYMNDMSMLNVDIVPNPEKAGKMEVLPMVGWFGGLQYNISPKVFITGTYGQSRLYSHNGYPAEASEQYRYGQYLVTNIFWNVTSNLQVGAEYLRGWRTDFDGDKRHANRLNAAVQYSF